MTDATSTDLLQRLMRLFSRDHLLGPGEGINLEGVQLIGEDLEWFSLIRHKAKKVAKSSDLCELDSFAGMASGYLWEHSGCPIEHRDALELYIDKEWDGCPQLSDDERFRRLIIRISTHACALYTHNLLVPDQHKKRQAENLAYVKRIEGAYRNALVPVGWNGNRETGSLMCKKISLGMFR